jgi:diacylglycerol O-acyltransferase
VRSMQLADLLSRSMRSVARVGSDVARGEVLLPPSPFTAPPTHFNRPVSPHRVIDGRFFDLEEIRAVKRTIPDATVNDVVLAICAGGLRSFLAARGELPRRPLVAMAPISVREAAQKDTLGNQVSAMLVSLATDQPDPRVRLETIHQSAVSSKAYTNAVGAKLLTDYSQFIPGATAALAARLYSQMRGSLLHPPIFNCVITNVPGPQVPLYSCGSRLVASFGGGPIFDGMGLIIPVGSYCGDLVVSVTSDREMLPEPAELCDAFVDAFTELKQATGIARPRAKRKPRASPRGPATGTRRES